jgi:hypothetical protein
MKSSIILFSILVLSLFNSKISSAQTAGTLTFSYTPTSHACYEANNNVLAIWIQSSTGSFVKTRMRRVGNVTSDHLPTWAVNSGGTANNALGTSCNVVSAATGATLTNFSAKNVSWDGTDVNGVNVPDGTYKITVQSTWDHGATGTATRSFTFTKGPNADVQTPAADGNFTAISLAWNPTVGGVEENTQTSFSVYPNPSLTGSYNLTFKQADRLTVIDEAGEEVYKQVIAMGSTTKTIDLSALKAGVYFIRLYIGEEVAQEKITISK